MIFVAYLALPLLLYSYSAFAYTVQHKVKCFEESMIVEIIRPNSDAEVYLKHFKEYPDEMCKPKLQEGNTRFLTFEFLFNDVFRCGLTRIHNSITGTVVYKHQIVIVNKKEEQLLNVKCKIENKKNITSRFRRNVLPAGFTEPEVLEITKNLTEKAPEPNLRVSVRQAGRLVTGELNVSPGTALQMELGLDPDSAQVYGLLVSHMQVSDTGSQTETIVFNGCSVDPYLFENFNTVDGDFLTAKFRAFKFPDSTYVQFKGTVNVCLDKCRGVECSNGQVGYGRRRRSIAELPPDPNKIFEISMSAFLKIDDDGNDLLQKVLSATSSEDEVFAKKANNTGEIILLEKEVYKGKFIAPKEQERYSLLLISNAKSNSHSSTNRVITNSIIYFLVFINFIKLLI